MKIAITEYCPKCQKPQPTRAESHSDLTNSYLSVFCAVCGVLIRTVYPGRKEKER